MIRAASRLSGGASSVAKRGAGAARERLLGDGRAAPAAAAVVVVAASVLGCCAAVSASLDDSKGDSSSSSDPRRSHAGLIEVDLMDKIASKPYVNYHNWTANASVRSSSSDAGGGVDGEGSLKGGKSHRRSPSRRWGSGRRKIARRYTPDGYGGGGVDGDDDDDVADLDEGVSVERGDDGDNRQRPRGVPRTVRILAVDVPEMREVFDGECHVSPLRAFPDDVAPRKRIKRNRKKDGKVNNNKDGSNNSGGDGRRHEDNHDNDATEVIQKSLARSLIKCRNRSNGRVGVEILEASVSNLNPRNVRRTYQFGGYRYDPGKYSEEKGKGAKGAKDEGEERTDMATASDNGSSATSSTEKGATSARTPATADQDWDEAGPADVDEYEGYVSETLRRETVRVQSRRTMPPPVQSSQVDDDIGPADVDEDVGYADVLRRDTIRIPREESSTKSPPGQRSDEKKKEDDEHADEKDAPWNQYAWIEEVDLRVNGLIPFSSPVERGSALSRYVFGNSYRSTVPPSRGWLSRWLNLPPALTGDVFGDDGVDGDWVREGSGPLSKCVRNRASSKPHAVVVDGSAMLRVPGSLRHLARTCREADVPLFIVNDPRGWGGNTHSDLAEAALDIRRSIKARTVVNALQAKEGSMFERGRLMGRIETEAKWRAKDAARKTRKAVEDARDRIKKERDEDWRGLDGEALRRKLAERRVIVSPGKMHKRERSEKEAGSHQPAEVSGKHEVSDTYSAGLIELCRQIVGDSDLRQTDTRSSHGQHKEELSISDSRASLS